MGRSTAALNDHQGYIKASVHVFLLSGYKSTIYACLGGTSSAQSIPVHRWASQDVLTALAKHHTAFGASMQGFDAVLT